VPRAIATSVYRIAQECLTNAMRHGKPSAVYLRVERLASRDSALALTVEDDGGGDPMRIQRLSGHGILGVHNGSQLLAVVSRSIAPRAGCASPRAFLCRAASFSQNEYAAA